MMIERRLSTDTFMLKALGSRKTTFNDPDLVVEDWEGIVFYDRNRILSSRGSIEGHQGYHRLHACLPRPVGA